MVSISACHAEDPGSIPGIGDLLFILPEFCQIPCRHLYLRHVVSFHVPHGRPPPLLVLNTPVSLVTRTRESTSVRKTLVLPTLHTSGARVGD